MQDDFGHFRESLESRKLAGTLRTLKNPLSGADFYSNDYLGMAKDKRFRDLLLKNILDNPELLNGSSGSRLISGNSFLAAEVEEYVAEKHQYEAALLLPSGYNANLALFSALPSRHDTVIVDENIHRSVHDACRLSHARKLKFRHNDVEDLERILKKQAGTCYIAVESLYSMDGDLAPLTEIAGLAEKYHAGLIVDEAHAFGVFGYGLVDRYQLQRQVLATVVTYGKALGTHGAAILTDKTIRSYLINFASPFIYTTAAHDFLWMSIREGYRYLEMNGRLQVQLRKNISVFRSQRLPGPSAEGSPVQAILIPDHQRLGYVKKKLEEYGFLTYAVFSPAVKEGTERLRICLHSFNTEKEISVLTALLKKYI